jgi:hypothetical protein
VVGESEICCILSEECACETGCVDSEPLLFTLSSQKGLRHKHGSRLLYTYILEVPFPFRPGLKSRIELIRLMLRVT